MPNTYTTRLGFAKPQGGETGWNAPVDANWDGLDGRLGRLAVRPASLDATTRLPTDRTYIVAEGGYISPAGIYTEIVASATLTATASATTYVWLLTSGTVGSGSSLPTDRTFAPLAKIVCDATRITAVTDLRGAIQFVAGGATLRMAVRGIEGPGTHAITAADMFVYVGATFGDTIVTLPALSACQNQLFVIQKSDASVNTVTVRSVDFQLAGPGVVEIVEDDYTWNDATITDRYDTLWILASPDAFLIISQG